MISAIIREFAILHAAVHESWGELNVNKLCKVLDSNTLLPVWHGVKAIFVGLFFSVSRLAYLYLLTLITYGS